jgi:septal ring-binding cell division protein DamX
MKKTLIVGLSVLLTACSSGTYTTNVTSESYQEDYTPKVEAVSEPVAIASTKSVVTENKTPEKTEKVTVAEAKPKQATTTKPVAHKDPSKSAVKITPPTKKQDKINTRFGYTIQVVAVGNREKVEHFSSKLPTNEQPIWVNYKIVNGTKWYTVLYGDYATSKKAKEAIAQLPKDFNKLKPFVKSINSIKKSDFPTLTKLN